MYYLFVYCLYVFTIYDRYGGTWIWVERTRESHTLDLHMGVPWETVTLTAFGRDRNLYFSILEEGKTLLLNPPILNNETKL